MKSKLNFEISMDDLKKYFDESEFSIEIKNTIVQEFSKRYLKGIFDKEMMNFCIKEIKDICFDKTYYFEKLNDKTIFLIKDLVDKSLNEIIQTKTHQIIFDLEKKLDEKFLSFFNYYLNNLMEKLLEKNKYVIENYIEKNISSLFEEKYKKVLFDKIKNKL